MGKLIQLLSEELQEKIEEYIEKVEGGYICKNWKRKK